LGGLQLDATERLAQLTQKHVLYKSGWDVIFTKKSVEFLHLLTGHPAEAANAGHAQFPLAEATGHVVLYELTVLVAYREGGFHGGLGDPVPVHGDAFEELLLEPDQPFLAHG